MKDNFKSKLKNTLKRYSRIVMIIIFSFTLISCWNYREINELSVVAGFGIDKGGKDNKYSITAEILQPEAKVHGGSAMESKSISSKGDTIFKAMRRLIEINGKMAYWAHAKVIVVSKDVAESGIVPIIDIIDRNPEARPDMYLVIAGNESAQDIFVKDTTANEVVSFKLQQMLDNESKISSFRATDIWEYTDELSKEGIEPVIAVVNKVNSDGKRILKLGGLGVIKKDKLVGILNEKESENYSLIMDKIKGGILEVNTDIIGNTSNVSLEILGGKTKKEPEYLNGKINMKINIELDVALTEIGGTDNYIMKEKREELKTKVEKYIKKEVLYVINKVKQEYNSDIFGFGNIIRCDMPKVWKTVNKNWDEEFKFLGTEVEVKLNIKKTELTSEPIKIGE